MAKKDVFLGESYSYIFDEAGGMRDQLEQTILSELEVKKYPLKATIKKVKAGGLFGSKEQCVVIDVDKKAKLTIANVSVGTYLYVEMFLTAKQPGPIVMLFRLLFFWLIIFFKAAADNEFKQMRRNAIYSACRETVESAFSKLQLKQSNSGYQGKSKK